MADPQGLAFWPGVRSLVSASFTLTPGISPNTATLAIPPQNGVIARAGTLVFRYGRVRIEFPGCALDSITERTIGTGHFVWELRILDRRWQWRDTGRISGFYNVRRGGKIVAETEKTPRELAKLCLDAMGEQRPDVRQLPNEARPEVDWDYTNPASALADLCDRFNCYVTIAANNRVRIWRDRVGQKLPEYPVLDGALEVDPPEPPEEIVMVGGRTRFQGDLELEPVGLEPDGRIVPIDELSYAPKFNGRVDWRFSDVQYFADIPKKDHRNLAQQSVFRWYRLKTPFRLPLIRNEIKDVSRILPLETTQIETWTVDGEVQERPPWVYGIWTPGYEDFQNTTGQQQKDIDNKPKGLYTRGFDVDTSTGIVRFAEPVYRWQLNKNVAPGTKIDTGQLVYPPRLWLRIAANLRDSETGGWLRFEATRKPQVKPKENKRRRYIIRDELTREIYHRWTRPVKLIDNSAEVRNLAEDYLVAELLKYRTDRAGSLSYAGFIPVVPDGLTRQVTWSIAESGQATTRVSQNREELFVAPSYRERRFLERLQRELEEQNKPARQRAQDLRKRGR